MSGWSELSESFAAAIEKAGPSVVRVDGRRRHSATGIVWSPGVVVTTNNALSQKEGNLVDLGDGVERPTAAVGHDPTTDLAVLRVEGGGGVPATFDDGADVKVGHLVLKLGRPGKSVRATAGIISARGSEPWRARGGTRIAYYLESDAEHLSGFSGGPLIRESGAIVGLNTRGLIRETSVTLPTATVRKVVEEILAHGRVRRSHLGVSTQPVRIPEALAQQLGGEVGLLISAVEPGGPAAAAGILQGDILVNLGGPEVSTLDNLQGFLADDHSGEVVPARIIRSGAVRDLNVTLAARSPGRA